MASHSGGCLRKLVKDGYYYKFSTYNSYSGFYGHESVNEYIASLIGRSLGLYVIATDLINQKVPIDGTVHRTWCSRTKSYKKTGETRIPLEQLYQSNKLPREKTIDFCQRTGMQLVLDRMFILDFLIINRDRHGANVELLMSDTKRVAPFFDNGLSFVAPYFSETDICNVGCKS